MPNRFHGCDPRVFDSCHPRPVLGIDEVGTGCIAGPVYAAGVVLLTNKEVLEVLVDSGLRDSKQMSAPARERVNDILMDCMFFVHVAFREARDIETHGLGNCLDSMYHEIISAYRDQHGPPGSVLLDGNHRSGLSYHHEGIVSGDQKSLTISAASVVAKVARDRYMIKLDETYPGYGFDNHKGYPTKQHIDALEKLGACAIHRRNTKALRKLLNPGQPSPSDVPCTAPLEGSLPGGAPASPQRRGRHLGSRPFDSDG